MRGLLRLSERTILNASTKEYAYLNRRLLFKEINRYFYYVLNTREARRIAKKYEKKLVVKTQLRKENN